MKKILIAMMLCLALVAMMFVGCSDEKAQNTDADNVQEENNTDVAEGEVNNGDEAGKDNAEGKEDSAKDAPVEKAPEEEPKLADDIALNPEKPEEVVNQLDFENVKLLAAIANAMGKPTAEVTKEDIEEIGYIGISAEETGDYTIYLGMNDYMNAYNEGQSSEYIGQFLKKSVMEYDAENDSFNDLAKFVNVISFEYYGIPIEDISFIKEYKNLQFAYFKDNGITDVSSLADYNPESLYEIDLTDNDIEDWSPLYHIKEKVIVNYQTPMLYDADGNLVPTTAIVLTLEDKLNQETEKQQAEETEETTETEENQEPSFVDENGEPVDFASLFE